MIVDAPRRTLPRRVPITSESRAQHERADRECARLLRRAPLASVSAHAAVRANHAVSAYARPSLDYSVEGDNPVSTPLQRREFIRSYSTSSTLKRCGSVYLGEHRKWNRCEHPLCDVCARKRANSRAASLAAETEQYADVIAVTLSLQSTPGSPLADLWDALDTARGRFVGDWLKTHVTAWRWSTEITTGSAGWHPHAAFLAFGNEIEVPQLEAAIRARWARIIDTLGYSADPEAQYVERITRTRGRALRYAQKGLTAAPAGSITPGVLLDRAAAGDASAAADWIELDEAAHDRRFQGTGGALRRRATTVLDFDALIAAGALG